LVVDGGEAALIDLPWNDSQANTLIEHLTNVMGARLRYAIPTHHHDDNLGGLRAAHAHGADSYSLARTIELARDDGAELPRHGFAESLDLSVGSIRLELRYLGAGHAEDNFVVWIPDRRILFTGCLVKAADASSIGNTDDADLEAWPRTVERLRAEFPEAELIVPGHGEPGGFELIDRTLELLAGLSGSSAAP
jgi:metallo-beta-lactamase class B